VTRRRVVAGLLSLLVPGGGHLYLGRRRRGAVLLVVSGALAALSLALVLWRPYDLAASAAGPLVAAFLAANAGLLALRLFAIVDAWQTGGRAASRAALAGLLVVVALAAAPHVATGYAAVRGYVVLDAVFADDEPGDVLRSDGVFLSPDGARLPPASETVLTRLPTEPLPGRRRVLVDDDLVAERPWVTMLLLGSDAGPGQWGMRTDTMIVVGIERGTGRAVALGIPRNVVDVPVETTDPELDRYPEPLNGLYAFARSRPELFPGGRNAGATAVKQTLSRLLGIRIDYYALVDLAGFVDVVDALGGVQIRVKERLDDEVTRPRWGESKPKIDVRPGRTYHFSGRTALAYVRSRKDSNDYTRMARQRCFLSAMAEQLNVGRALRNFDTLADTVQESVRTDVPLSRLPDLLRLVAAVNSAKAATQTFGPEFFAYRRPSDGYPVADAIAIRSKVREVFLDAGRPRAERTVETLREAC
jgi:polyisoprenyl-teichoic acid--peptidoglycan teichoic acid transferase